MQHISVDAGRLVPVGGYGIAVTGENQALRPLKVGAGHHVVVDSYHVQPGNGPQTRFDQIANDRFVVADRSDVDKIRGGPQQIVRRPHHVGRILWWVHAGPTRS